MRRKRACDARGECQYLCNDWRCDSSDLDCYEPSSCLDNACGFRDPSPAGAPCSIGVCNDSGTCLYVCEDSDCQTPLDCRREPSSCSGNACSAAPPFSGRNLV